MSAGLERSRVMKRFGCRTAVFPCFFTFLFLAVGIARGADGVAQSGAFDTTLQTVLTDLQQASQQTPTQTLQVVTAGAVEPTLCPIAATQCPVVETQCPALETRCPKTATRCPVAETTCPPLQTRCPVAETTCPPSLTKCPVAETHCPASET